VVPAVCQAVTEYRFGEAKGISPDELRSRDSHRSDPAFLWSPSKSPWLVVAWAGRSHQVWVEFDSSLDAWILVAQPHRHLDTRSSAPAQRTQAVPQERDRIPTQSRSIRTGSTQTGPAPSTDFPSSGAAVDSSFDPRSQKTGAASPAFCSAWQMRPVGTARGVPRQQRACAASATTWKSMH
jgi:hypothetical protein